MTYHFNEIATKALFPSVLSSNIHLNLMLHFVKTHHYFVSLILQTMRYTVKRIMPKDENLAFNNSAIKSGNAAHALCT